MRLGPLHHGSPRRSRGQQRLVRPSRLPPRTLLAEALAGMLQRPTRSALTGLGTVLGVGTFVAILGLTATTSAQIGTRFNELKATQVTVHDTGGNDPAHDPDSFPEDAGRKVERLHGVTAAGVSYPVRNATVAAASVGTRPGADQIPVVAASPGLLKAADPRVRAGRTFDGWDNTTGQRVAVLGASVAAQLGISTLQNRPAIYLAGKPYLVVGIVSDVRRRADLLLSVTIPRVTAEHDFGTPGARAQMLIATRLGAARQVASEVKYAIDPRHPGDFKVTAPPDPESLKGGVTTDLNQLFLLLAAICLVIGAVGIANTTLVAVLERTGEIGLRRALGARGRHITAQFLAESGSLGLVGGLVGTSLGVLTVLLVAVVQRWTPVVDPTTVVAAPVIGLVTGVLAGLYPAARAARIEPAEALRR